MSEEQKTNEQLKQESIDEIQKWSKIQMEQVQMWVQSLARASSKFDVGSQVDETYNLFWTRLNQLFQEIMPYYASTLETLRSLYLRKELADPSTSGGKMNEIYSAIVAKIEEIEGSFTEDELITIEYERHCNCHVFQKHYLKQGHAKEDGTIKFKRIERKGKKLEDVNASIEKVLRANKNGFGRVDEWLMAVTFSKRIHSKIIELRDLVDKWISDD